jgi:tRNA-Thr(GGU) m(6)t(6)A37 methyltransferase TsaA
MQHFNKRKIIMDRITYKPIGIIHSPFTSPEGTPIQPTGLKAINAQGTVELFEPYAKGLKDLDGFSHIYLLFHFHCAKPWGLNDKPYMDDEEHGVFSMRVPNRPNSIGLSIVRLTSIEDNTIHIKEVDIIDGTPLLDIKPYVREFDMRGNARIGWLEKVIHKLPLAQDDGRFARIDK